MGGTFKWPTVEEVVKYRTKVKDVVIEVIETAPLHLPIHHDHPWVNIYTPCTIQLQSNKLSFAVESHYGN